MAREIAEAAQSPVQAMFPGLYSAAWVVCETQAESCAAIAT